jgi:hypothetical protein
MCIVPFSLFVSNVCFPRHNTFPFIVCYCYCCCSNVHHFSIIFIFLLLVSPSLPSLPLSLSLYFHTSGTYACLHLVQRAEVLLMLLLLKMWERCLS